MPRAPAPRPSEPPDAEWHRLPADEVARRLGSDSAGLPPAEAERRIARDGANELPRREPPGFVRILARQLASPLALVLLGAAAVSLLLVHLADAGFIASVLLVNAAIGAAQERKAELSAAELDRLVAAEALVRRDGQRVRVAAAKLAVGDLVELEPGSAVPADLRLIAATRLTIDEALLTGESLPTEKDAAAALPAATPLAERSTMAYAGSLVLAGEASGIAVATGARTELGRIAEALDRGEATAPPLVRRLAQLGRGIGFLVLAAVAAFAVTELLLGMALSEVFFTSVALAVSAIPEGLPVAITIVLSLAARRMARHKVIVRSLAAVEGLGACTVIASDKTGTLTRNRLAVQAAWVPGVGPVPPGDREAARRLAASAALTSRTTDAVDRAIAQFARTVAPAPPDFRQVAALPYQAKQRFGAVFVAGATGVEAFVKGAPEVVLGFCRGEQGEAARAAERLAAEGLRVIAVAGGPVGPGEPSAASLAGLELLGVLGLADEVRPSAAPTVREAQKAGIRVLMVTGDHPSTALAVGRQIGIAQDAGAVITGDALAAAEADAARLRDAVVRRSIFARTAPLQKLTIVRALQEAGESVAVTGDGVNDAPALAAAEISVAMGRGGTEVARHAADLVLTDNDFGSIVAGIREGRTAYANIRKVVWFVLATAIAEVLLFFIAVALGLPLPLVALQLLWLNVVTDTIQHVALALEPAERDVMARPPRPPTEKLLDRRLVAATLASATSMALLAAASFAALLAAGRPLGEARNILVLLMVVFENVQLLSCRSEQRSIAGGLQPNPWIWIVIATTQAVHVGAMFTPGLRDVLGIAPVGVADWLAVGCVAALLLGMNELAKRWVARL